jgi:hypothetical protein
MSNNAVVRGQKVMLNQVRLSYVNIFRKKDWADGTEPKYQVRILIHPDNKKLLSEITNVSSKLVTANFKGQNVKRVLNREVEEIADVKYYYINASTKRKLVIVDRQCQPITDEEEVYSGCYANVQIYLTTFTKGGNKGLSAILQGVQKIEDGPRLDEDTTVDFQPLDPVEKKAEGFTEFNGEIEFK